MRNFLNHIRRLRYAIFTILLVIIASTFLAFYNLERFEEFSTFNLKHEGILLSYALQASITSEKDLKNTQELQARIDKFISASNDNIEINILLLDGDGSIIVASSEPGNIEQTSAEEHANLLISLDHGKPVAFIDEESEDDDDARIESDNIVRLPAEKNGKSVGFINVDDDDFHAQKKSNFSVSLFSFQKKVRFLSITTPLIFDGKPFASINTKLSLDAVDEKIGSMRQSIRVAVVVEVILLLAGFAILVKLFMEEKLNLLTEESLRYQAELKALQSQINPHFLFNTLNSLASLISANPDQAENLTIELSELFRKILGASKKGWWSISEEMELIGNYLNIESARLGKKLEFSILLSPLLKSVQIPCLVIEPLVENAIQHGINTSVLGGKINIEIKKVQSDLIIIVEDILTVDDSYPLSEALKGENIGINNVIRRLNLIYDNAAELILKMHEYGATATITIKNFRSFKHDEI